MQSKVHNLIVSSIKRNKDTKMAVAETKVESDVKALSESLLRQLTTLFKGQGIKVGDFESIDGKPKKFEKRLRKYVTFDDDVAEIEEFEEFAGKVATLLANSLNEGKAIIAKDGYLLTYLYSEFHEDEDEDEDFLEESSFLCLVFLHRISGTDINDNELILEEIERVSLDSLNLGAKISLTQWNDEDSERVLSFKLGKKTGDVRDYFTKFLGCSETIDHIQDTESLKEVIIDLCDELEKSEEEKNNILESAKSYCLDRIKNYSESVISVDALSKSLFPHDEDNAELFLDKSLNDYRLSEQLTVDSRTLRTFSRLSGQTKDYRVSFSRKALAEKTVEYNQEKSSLTFKNLPQELIDELNRI